MKITSSRFSPLLFIALFSLGAHAHRAGNGGHSIAAHFSAIASNIAIVWDDMCVNKQDPHAYCEYRKDFKKTLDKDSSRYIQIKAESVSSDGTHTCKIDEDIREACNDGQNLIVINADAWSKINTNERIINLVLHEIFSVLELDSSDHYEYSLKVASLLKRKGINLDKLTAFEVLPDPCSISVTEKTNVEGVQKLIVPDLLTKKYAIKEESEKTRYDLKMMTKCERGTLNISCGVYSQLTDNYTNKVVYSDMQIGSGLRNQTHKIFEGMKAELNTKIKECKLIQ